MAWDWRQAAPVIGAAGGFLLGGPGGAALGYQVGSGLMGQYGQEQTNEANRDIANQANQMSQTNAREQMAFQREMSNTAHQREVSDLRAAGLNPILSVNAGSSSPSGASGGVTTSQMQNPNESIAASAREVASNILQMQMQKKQIELMEAQTRKTNTDERVARTGIPESEIKNDLWNSVKKRFKDATSVNAQKGKTPKADQRAKEMKQKFGSAQMRLN